MSWQHVTESPDLLSKLAKSALRLRRVLLSRQIRHLEAMVKSHAHTLSKQPGGVEQVEKTLQLMKDLRQQLGEDRG